MIELVLIGAGLSLPLGLAFALGRWRPEYSRRKIALLAGLAVPLPIALLCGVVIVGSFLTPAEKCGVDACGMAMMAGMFLLAMAMVMFAVGSSLAFAVVNWVRRGSAVPPIDSVFE